MDFTREPILETVITPREGCKLAIRSSKSVGQEEYFVDAVEVVSFGNAFFYRSLEKPKCFLLPILDYEVLEVREARMVLRQATSEKPIKIGKPEEKREPKKEEEAQQEPKGDRKRDRRRNMRKRRGQTDEPRPDLPKPTEEVASLETPQEARESASSIIRSLLTPPPLVSEQIGQYRETYKQAFFDVTEEESSEESEESEEEVVVSSDEPEEEKNPDDLWNFSKEI